MNKKHLLVLYCLVTLPTVCSPAKSNTAERVLAASASEKTFFFKHHKNLEFNDRALAQKIGDRYSKKIPLQSLSKNLTLAQAIKVRDRFIELLMPTYGKPIGYKVGLTNKKIQAKLKIDRPVSGVLLKKMLLKDGAIVPAKFGARPIVEGDLIVRVGSEKINRAKTPQEVINYLEPVIIPFLELPDLMYAENVKLTAPQIVAINVGARWGVVGKPIVFQDSQKLQETLPKIKIIISDENGDRLATGDMQTGLGDPLKIVLGLRDDLQARGKVLKKGDLISLGAIAPTIPVRSNMMVRARYIGLDGDRPVELSVKFE
jgi:2-keto-4-pentenoate hydratase